MILAEPMLYTLERKEDFKRVPVGDPRLLELARGFGASPVGAARRIDKCNRRTELYEVDTSLGCMILRSSEVALAAVLGAQCATARAAAAFGLIQPVARGGGYVAFEAGRAWIAYPAIAGAPYDGWNAPLEEVMRASWDLIGHLRALPDMGLPRATHRPFLWPAVFDTLTRPDACAHALVGSGTALTSATLNLLQAKRARLLALSARVAELTRTLEAKVVHNDLQHANIISYGQGVAFVDLEDVTLESPHVALMHGVFKVVRHLVYCGVSSVAEVRHRLPGIEHKLLSHPAWAGARGSPFDYAALRIVSDVAETLAAWTQGGDRQDLYDLEKRIHNLFELLDLYQESETWN